MVSLRPCRTFRGPAFDRFDEILDLVEKTSDLTLPDLVRRRTSIRCDILSQLGLESRFTENLHPWRRGPR